MAKKSKPGLSEEIILPSGVTASVNGSEIRLKKDSKEIIRKIDTSVKAKVEENKIILTAVRIRKNERRLMGAAKSHIKNMIDGLEKNFEYELEICNVHFPITANFDKAKGEFVIKNLLGERSPRVIKAFHPEKIEVEIKAPNIRIKSYDVEIAGQNAANLEKATRIRNRDRNKFQDGIFITKKPGRSFL